MPVPLPLGTCWFVFSFGVVPSWRVHCQRSSCHRWQPCPFSSVDCSFLSHPNVPLEAILVANRLPRQHARTSIPPISTVKRAPLNLSHVQNNTSPNRLKFCSHEHPQTSLRILSRILAPKRPTRLLCRLQLRLGFESARSRYPRCRSVVSKAGSL